MRRKTVILALIAACVCILSVPVGAAPHRTPFLAVDIDGNEGGGTGPLQTAPPNGYPDWPTWQGWPFPNTITDGPTWSKTFDSVSVTITTINKVGWNVGSRNRAEPPEANNGYLNNLYRDFFFVQHTQDAALGEDCMKLDFGGLEPNKPYEFTVFNWDAFFVPSGTGATKYMAWGLENPTDYPAYQPTAGGGGLAPKLARVRMAGLDPCDPLLLDAFFYSGSFTVRTDASGAATIYGWLDKETWSDSSHAPLNGFAIGIDPNANYPQPSDEESDVELGLTTLTWEAGFWAQDANAHRVYFGTDYNDVNNADTDTAGIYLGNPTEKTCQIPTALASGRTYYWRVDEVNDACAPGSWKGKVWQFTSVAMVITKCTVTAGKTQGADSGDVNKIKDSFDITGTVVLPSDLNDINRIDVNIISATDGEVVYTEAIDFNAARDIVKNKYNHSYKIPKYHIGAITSMKMDLTKNTIAIKAKNIDLTGLQSPLEFDLIMGDTTFVGQADETIINKTKRIPTRLMRMYEDKIVVTKATAKHSTKPLSDSLSVTGEIAVADINNTDMNEPNLAARDVNFIWGDQTFAVGDGNFVAAKTGHKYTCKKVPSDVNEGLVSATFDLDKCTFTISVKDANNLNVLPDYQNVNFSINYGIGDANDFNETANVNLVTRRSY